ncbi:photosystem II reaction center protein Ycf12 [Lyngbya confervoides BDU141951]|uniref:Photosystem II reaction center protein Psb30 n=1 Tax=Lyngbya confervoides BDU141951 TaxID=1574623 RepID=A0ABD4T0I8_9CYAN|nr:photosystem II reaction center protein Ycf12 [Lyngbya confervoides]MCM1982281.1 photosystem II reaction center protein Ycf12 [Lyngbya confervoides BDU141951]
MTTLAALNFEVIFQLTMLAMIILAGPIIVGLLVLRGGDL